MNEQDRRKTDEPELRSDKILLSVEDLIHTAFGPSKDNKVHFKLLQSVFLILARELRLLQQGVEIKFDDITEFALKTTAGYDDSYDDGSVTNQSSSAERKEDEDRAGKEDEGGAERGRKKDEMREKKDQADKKDEGGAERGRKKDEIRGKKDRAGKEENGDTKDRRKKVDEPERDGEGEKVEKWEKEERKGRRRKGEKEDGKTSSEYREDKGRSKDRDTRSRDRDKRSTGRRGEDKRDGELRADGRKERGGELEDRKARRQDRGGLGRRDFGRQTSSTSITISEATRRGPGGRGSADKILVAEWGPAARGRPARVGSIEVVTASQFALLAEAVKQLEQITGPQPAPVLPDDETLRQDLAKGRASLQDTMQAVQLNERVQAAEQDLYRLAELVTKLTKSGMLPPEFKGHVGAMEEYLQAVIAAGHAAAGPDDPGGRDGPGGPDGSGGPDSIEGTASTESPMDEKKLTATVTAEADKAQGTAWVKHTDMQEVMQKMEEAILKEIMNCTACGDRSAEMASNTARSVEEKMDIALQVDERINTLFQQTAAYDQQLSGFDNGISIHVHNFQKQLVIMREDLGGGLALLDTSHNNAETVALLELTEHHQGLVVELENTVHLHKNLFIAQQQISDEIKNLIECVEMLREQKAGHNEVLDGLEDKANVSCLAGLLQDEDFTNACFEIEDRLAKCYEKFNEKDMKWQDALKALLAMTNKKGDMIRLRKLKEIAEEELNAIEKLLHKLDIMLGEPKEAILMHKLAEGATCAACLTRAVMEPKEPTYSQPLPLPALRPPPLGAEQQPSLKAVKLVPHDTRVHTCHRWVGGSHTLITGVVKKRPKNIKPTKKFERYGSDGRIYMMEEDMQPCAECNKLSADEPGKVPPRPSTPTGVGDQASAPPAL